jgi:isopropylmalate/homocitrate/citramalate synthase
MAQQLLAKAGIHQDGYLRGKFTDEVIGSLR